MRPNLSWSLEPGVLAVVALGAAAYVPRWLRVRREDGARAAPVWRLACFSGGLLAVLAALVSPLDSLADQALFMHMGQHVLLLDVAPILCILGLTKAILRPATRRLSAIERQAGLLAHPAFAVFLYVGTIWIWHVPAAYDAALRHYPVHVAEHVSFALAGGLYWWHLLSPIRSRMRLGGMGPIVYMASTKLLVGAMGMGLAFGSHAIYGYYIHRPQIWGLTPLTDQSIAGLLMAVEQSIVMGIALVVLFVRMLIESEREQQRRERFELPA
jgi:putative membrane protein